MDDAFPLFMGEADMYEPVLPDVKDDVFPNALFTLLLEFLVTLLKDLFICSI